MLIYGVCISDIEKINEEKAMEFLKELDRSYGSYYLEKYLEDKEDHDDEDYSFNDWMYDYEYNGYYGLSAFLVDVIEHMEEINIACDDPDGVHYLGLSASAPWKFNEKTRNMPEKEFCELLSKYVEKVTDDELKIRWWSSNE